MTTRQKVASELLKLAKELLATDFPTQDALDKYLKDHPDAERSNHKVVEKKPAKKTDEFKDRGNAATYGIREDILKHIGGQYKKEGNLYSPVHIKLGQGWTHERALGKMELVKQILKKHKIQVPENAMDILKMQDANGKSLITIGT